ncbi:kinesin-like nuclear fusion protein [Linnemannia gamsii]|uniref:Kinesin-like nuclear fusion protein n=1 Tax=Linnemannia gamsii TaxID=64522 RepID=A0A9P6QXL0_9FUNG|nr:kinesin-like nuclear fusion protein [Linnemannia gamsii]
MDQLNRSLSKLKPPSTIVRSNSSSALSTALAVAAAAMNENENYSATAFFGNRSIGTTTTGTDKRNEPKKDHTLTLEMLEPLPPKTVAGVKRKAEDEPPSRPSRVAAAGTAGPSKRPTSNTRGATATTAGAARKVAGAAAGTQRQQHPPPTKPAGRAQLQAQTRQTSRAIPAARPATAKAPLTSGKAGPTAAASRATRTTTPPVPAGGRPRAVLSARPKTGPSQPVTTRATTRSRSTTPATGTQPAQPRGAGKAAEVSVDIELPAKKKRAAWDTKGRLQDMEEVTGALYDMLNKSTGNITEMTQSLESNANKISELESFRIGLESKVVDKDIEHSDMLQKMSTVEQEIFMLNRKHLDNTKAMQSKQEMEVDQQKSIQARLQQDLDTTESSLRIATNQLEQQIQESANLRTTISTQSSNCLSFETDNRALKLKIERTEGTVAKRVVTIKELERQLSDSETQARKLQQKAKDEEASRRKLSNAIMDLKGHIRVFCRVRPYGSTDDAVASINYPDLEGREIVLAPTKGPKYPFTFDKVFAATSSQEDIFDEVSYMLPSIMNGGNACVFAYGATQTGKSYTLEGPSSTAEEPLGLIPRSILWIYEATRAPESNDWRYTVEVRHIGIYNETIYDLHAPEGSSTGTKHEIHSIAGNKIIVSGVNMTELKSAVMMGSLLRTAQRRQASIRTSLKDGYYSGHSVFTIRVVGVNSGTGKTKEGVLHFVDLVASDAASEVAKKDSGFEDSDKKKAPEIDQSLKGVEDVILTLSSHKDSQAPYLGSKLTHLLQGSFVDGNTKMLFVVHISPLSMHLEQTLRSLRFAAKVNNCLLVGGLNSAPSPSTSSSSAAAVPRKAGGSGSTSSSATSSSSVTAVVPRRSKLT